MFINCLYKIDNCRYIQYRYSWDGGARSLDKPAPITARKFSHEGGNTRAERNERRRPSGIFVRLIAAARIVSGRQVGRNHNDTFSGKTTTEFKAAAATTRGVYTRTQLSSRCRQLWRGRLPPRGFFCGGGATDAASSCHFQHMF